MLEFFSPDEEATARLAAQIASRAQSGDMFALYGTLGMGKSVFARAFIQALTGAEEVPSPTFTLLQTYDAPEFEIYHYDLYRLKSPMHPLSKPGTYHNPYSPNSVREGIPACPRPYETYTGKEWMLSREKEK